MQHQSIIAAKFGGTSVKDAASIIHLRDNIIPHRDDGVRYGGQRLAIVVSAPAGMTNQLIMWAEWFIGKFAVPNNREILAAVEKRFAKMVRELGLSFDIHGIFRDIEARCVELKRHGSTDELYEYAVSRGEWINAQIVAAALGFEFVDALNFIVVDKSGHCKLEATKRLAGRIGLKEKVRRGIVGGGFYGRASSGRLRPKLFSRGGSDITGAILAVLIDADVYENWTDVTGILAANPGIVENPVKIGKMSYKELRELTFMGFNVFHEDAVAFVRNANIPIHLRCTMTPDTPGTLIEKEVMRDGRIVTGIAGKNGFSIITVEKFGMNDETGIQSRIERVFTRLGLSVNTVGSIDSVTVIVETARFESCRQVVFRELSYLQPDDIRLQDHIALICTVGEGMRNRVGTSAAVSSALADAGVNIDLELQGGSQINIIRGVGERDAPRAINALYNKFFK